MEGMASKCLSQLKKIGWLGGVKPDSACSFTGAYTLFQQACGRADAYPA